MTKTDLALVFLLVNILLMGDAYGNTQLKRSFVEKDQSSKKIGPYSHGKKVSHFFHPSTKNTKKRGKWTRKKPKNNWSIIFGGLGAVKPEYKGSSQYHFNV